MAPLDLREFAERLRITGTSQECDFADEILTLLDLESEVAEPYWKLCDDLAQYAKVGKYPHGDKPEKVVEWLGDRSNLLDELKEEFGKHNRTGDIDDETREVLETLADAETILRKRGHWTEGEFLDALATLAEREPALKYDL